MKRARLVMAQLIVTMLVFAASALGQTSWWRTYGGSEYDYGNSVMQTADGGYVITGCTHSFGAGEGDVYLIRTDAQSNTLWTRTYGGASEDEGFSVQPTSDGGFVVAGRTHSFGAGGYDVYLIKTNSQGDTVWTRTYGGTRDEVGRSVQQTTGGGYIITGYTYSFGAGDEDVYLIKTNAQGDTLWTRTYGGDTEDMGRSVQQTADGGYIIAGTSFFDVYLVKTNVQGDTLWTRTYGGAGFDWGRSVQQTNDGGYIIAGYTNSFGAGNFDVWLIKTDDQGGVLWTRTYGGADDDEVASVQQTTDGGYIITGYTRSFGQGTPDYDNVYLIKTNESGDTLWTRTYGGLKRDEGNSVQQTSDGGYVIAGFTCSLDLVTPDSENVYLIKTDSLGNVSGIQEPLTRAPVRQARFLVRPNPFTFFARVPGHETERFILSDVSGRMVGICKGNRIGEGLPPGVYFLSPVKPATPRIRPLRIVKGG